MAEAVGMFTVAQTVGSVLCCKCGILMQPNAANVCANCLRSEIDITEGLEKLVILCYCPQCERYLQPPRTWINAHLESNELLAFCVNRLRSMNTVRIVHAAFIWTEPHSKRIRVKLWVQKEVLHGAILEQTYIVEYSVQHQMCESCARVQANPDQWVAAVQLRQHVSHRHTFFYLEQLILKHDAAKDAIRIKQMHQGIDFFFGKRRHGVKFVEFLGRVAPTRSRSDKQLVSQDQKSNTYHYKYTFSVEISPICREDLICLPPKLAVSLGNLGPLVICSKVSNSIALLDPHTLRHCFLDSDRYWRTSFKALLSSRQLIEYIVISIEPVSNEAYVGGSRCVLADAEVARVSDFFGGNNITYLPRTHLGHILTSGDHVLGYDLYGANNNSDELDSYRGLDLPDVILVKKSYEERWRKSHGKPRAWKLKSLNMEAAGDGVRGRDHEEKTSTEYEQFLRDLEENPDLISKLSLYQNKEYQPSEMASVTDGEDVPSVPLVELLADLDLADDESVVDGMME